MPLTKKAIAEFFARFWQVFGGCGSAVLAAAFGLPAGKRFVTADLFAYLIAQLLEGVAGAGVLYLITRGKPGSIWRGDLRRTDSARIRRVDILSRRASSQKWC